MSTTDHPDLNRILAEALESLDKLRSVTLTDEEWDRVDEVLGTMETAFAADQIDVVDDQALRLEGLASRQGAKATIGAPRVPIPTRVLRRWERLTPPIRAKIANPAGSGGAAS